MKKGKQNVNSSKVIIDGIKFQSTLEGYAYKKLKEIGVPFEYEQKIFTLIDSFKQNAPSWETKHGKFIPRTETVRAITYKPDFTCPDMLWVIEVKGRPNELFPMRWKLFKRHLSRTGQCAELFLPKNRKEVDIAVQWVKDNQQQ